MNKITVLDAGFGKLHPGLFGQMLVRSLLRDEGILTQMCGNNYRVVKASPPLTSSGSQIEQFLEALERTLERIHAGGGFWSQGPGIAARALKVS